MCHLQLKKGAKKKKQKTMNQSVFSPNDSVLGQTK